MTIWPSLTCTVVLSSLRSTVGRESSTALLPEDPMVLLSSLTRSVIMGEMVMDILLSLASLMYGTMPKITPESTLLVSTEYVTVGTEVDVPVDVVSTLDMKSTFLPTLRNAVWPFMIFTLGLERTLILPCCCKARIREVKSPPVIEMLKFGREFSALVNPVVPAPRVPTVSHPLPRKLQSTP